MIRIEGLTKKYRSQNRRVCVALDGIHLTLPDTGLVFIIGKSGSGKSTLLNLIGGLDNFDKGRIVADGNDLSRFSGSDFYKYRASYVGFIFQDYHLLEELTVGENIALEAEIAGVRNANVEAALSWVDLAGYETRYPDELSGGQKQRVAIARALIKSPRALLCDEPTGNLDKNTSRQIMELLRRISRERLVLIVSHNLPDAEKYGDRIIELSEGKVISDVMRRWGYRDELCLHEGVLTLPYGRRLTEHETGKISRAIRQGRVRAVVQNDMGYEDTKAPKPTKRRIPLRSSPLGGRSIWKLLHAFGRVGRVRAAITAFLCAVMVVLLVIFQSFLSFDGSSAIEKSLGTAAGGTVVLKKDTYEDEYGMLDTSMLYRVSEEDLAVVDALSGHQTKKYLLYNYSSIVDMRDLPVVAEREGQYTYNFGKNHIYSPQMPGVLACDEGYLLSKFGVDGELKVLAGDIEPSRTSSAIILTDYLADAMMLYNPIAYHSYEDIIGKIEDRCIVTAIIDTGYKTRYRDLIDIIQEREPDGVKGIDAIEKEAGMHLIDDIKNNLSIAYSINPDFYTAAVTEDSKSYTRLANFVLGYQGQEFLLLDDMTKKDSTGKLKEGEIYLSHDIINTIFPEESKEKITYPFEITLTRYEYPNKSGAVLASYTYQVVGSATRPTMCKSDYEKIKATDIIPFAVYLEDYDDIAGTISAMQDRYFSWSSTSGKAITLLNQSVNMFFDLFRLIEVMILVMTAVFLVSHSVRSVRSHYYQIGVIKAIGGRSRDIAKIFLVQNAILSLVIALLTYLGSLYFIDVANTILTASFMEITEVAIGAVTIISFRPSLVFAAIVATVLIALFATAVPLLMLHNIKPMHIIKAKE